MMEIEMKRILFIRSSLFAGNSASSQLGEEFVTQIVERNPGSTVTTLDLATDPLPHLGAEEFSSWLVDTEERSVEQKQQAKLSDRLIDELFAHDTLVLSVPMYNLGIPSTLKAWIDRVARAGKTFRYTARGPEGLVKQMQTYVLLARGGQYQGTPMDTQTGYLKGILGLMGMSDVETVYAENLARGGDARENSLNEARQSISQILGATRGEVQYATA
jgi:FMN-dependent NADH-azoreductase